MSFVNSFIDRNITIENKKIILSDDFLHFLKEHIKDKKRLKHSFSVANLCYEVACSNNLKEPLKYYLVGVLHDIGKNASRSESIDIVDRYYHHYLNFPYFSYHQFVAEYLVMKKLCIYDREVLDAVKYHCTGCTNMSTTSKIVYACDKIDPLRGFDSSSLIKAMMDDCETGFVIVLEANLEYLVSKAKNDYEKVSIFNKLSKDCFDQYLKK